MPKLMRTVRYKIKRIILIVSLVILMLMLGLISWYRFAWSRYIDRDKVIELTEQINNSDRLPDNFYTLYDSIYPGNRNLKIRRTYIAEIVRLITPGYVSHDLISPTKLLSRCFFQEFPTEHKMRFNSDYSIYFSFALDKYTSPEKCFDYYVNHFDFLYQKIGLDSASYWYFDTSIDKLKQDELIGLIAMLENPALYNPRRQPERHARKVAELKGKIED